MKAEPVFRALAELEEDLERLLVHTGQHYDDEISAVFIDELAGPPVTVELGTNTILGVDPGRIRAIPHSLDEESAARPIPLWDGQAGARAAEVIVRFLERAEIASAPSVAERDLT